MHNLHTTHTLTINTFSLVNRELPYLLPYIALTLPSAGDTGQSHVEQWCTP